MGEVGGSCWTALAPGNGYPGQRSLILHHRSLHCWSALLALCRLPRPVGPCRVPPPLGGTGLGPHPSAVSIQRHRRHRAAGNTDLWRVGTSLLLAGYGHLQLHSLQAVAAQTPLQGAQLPIAVRCGLCSTSRSISSREPSSGFSSSQSSINVTSASNAASSESWRCSALDEPRPH